MAFELERILYETEDFLIRSLGSRERREAKKRKAQRQFMEFLRRARRAGLILAACGRLVAASIALGGITAELGGRLPTSADRHALDVLGQIEPAVQAIRRPRPPPSASSPARGGRPVDRCNELPSLLCLRRRDQARLSELQPHLDGLEPQSVLAGDARRLIGEHLRAGRFLSRTAASPGAALRKQHALHREPRHRRHRARQPPRNLLPRPPDELRHPAPLHRNALQGRRQPAQRIGSVTELSRCCNEIGTPLSSLYRARLFPIGCGHWSLSTGD